MNPNHDPHSGEFTSKGNGAVADHVEKQHRTVGQKIKSGLKFAAKVAVGSAAIAISVKKLKPVFDIISDIKRAKYESEKFQRNFHKFHNERKRQERQKESNSSTSHKLDALDRLARDRGATHHERMSAARKASSLRFSRALPNFSKGRKS